MNTIFAAYDLHLEALPELYRKLNAPVRFPDGMVTSLGIIYWGREEHMPELERALPALQAAGLQRLHELLETVRTPSRMAKFAQQTGLSAGLLRVLKHDVELWLPRPVPLAAIELLQEYAAYGPPLAQAGIADQLALISACQRPPLRTALAEQVGLPLQALTAITRCADMYRMGDNLSHIRARLYYQMGMDTWQKWADSTAEAIIQQFTTYIQQQGLEAVRLVPWPKEVRNGIEWAKMHLSMFAVAW